MDGFSNLSIVQVRYRSGLNMARYVHSKDKKVYDSMVAELEHFQVLAKRYETLLRAIAEL